MAFETMCSASYCHPFPWPALFIFRQFVEYKELAVVVSKLNSRAKIPDRRAVLQRMRVIKKGLEADVSLMLDDEYVSVTTDAWTSRNNESYMSLTVSFIDSDWKLHTLSLDCSKHSGSTTGEDLAEWIEDMIERHGLKGRVIVIVTDCEPSMIKGGRLLEAHDRLLVHIGCTNHRLESTTSSVFNGKSLGAMTLARALVGRYKKSSQMAARLAMLCGVLQMTALCVMQDVETRWWSSWAMVSRLVYLRRAIQYHESMDEIHPLLSNTDWEVLKLVSPILEPFMAAQKSLEGAEYVTGSLTIATIGELRVGLEEAMKRLRSAAGDDNLTDDARKAMAIVLPDAEALWADFINRWGDGTAILESKEGRRRQPQGFKLPQVCATSLDPRTKHLYGIPPQEHAAVWSAVAKETVELALQKEQSCAKAPVPAQASPVVADSVEAQESSKRARLSPFEAAAAAHAVDGSGSSADPPADDSRERVATAVDMEVTAFKNTRGIRVWQEVGGKKVYNNPLQWWHSKQRDFPLLAALARRVLALPATQAQSERMFSTAGLIVTPARNLLSSENVELLVYLRNVWGVVDKWRMSARKK